MSLPPDSGPSDPVASTPDDYDLSLLEDLEKDIESGFELVEQEAELAPDRSADDVDINDFSSGSSKTAPGYTLDANFNLVDASGKVVRLSRPEPEFLVNRNPFASGTSSTSGSRFRSFSSQPRLPRARNINVKHLPTYDPSLPVRLSGSKRMRKTVTGGLGSDGRRMGRGALVGGFDFREPGEFLALAKRRRTMRTLRIQHRSVLESLSGAGTTSIVTDAQGEGEIDEVAEMESKKEVGMCQLVVGMDPVPEMEPWDMSFQFESYSDILLDDEENEEEAEEEPSQQSAAASASSALAVPVEDEEREGEETKLTRRRKKVRSRTGGVLIQHPVEIPPNWNMPRLLPQPLMLTKKERKKLRKRERLQREREKQQKIRVGLIPPPLPKANLQNFMKVYLNDGTQDPTRLEKEIRRQMAERVENHERRNQERKLTSDQRRAKKMRLEDEDRMIELCAMVYKVGDLSHPGHRFKIRALAYQYALSGCALSYGDRHMILVEGGRKNLHRFHGRLGRINWNITSDTNEPINFALPEFRDRPRNRCKHLWTGTIPKSQFSSFVCVRFEDHGDSEADDEGESRRHGRKGFLGFVREHRLHRFWSLSQSWMDE